MTGSAGRAAGIERSEAVRTIGLLSKSLSVGHHAAERVLAEVLSERAGVSFGKEICCREIGGRTDEGGKVPESERPAWLEREVTRRLTGADRDVQSMATSG